MNMTLVRALVALAPASALLFGSVLLWATGRTVWALLQVIGAGGLVVVTLTHVFEALHWFSWMQWGLEQSAGHYLDLSCAVLGVTLFPIGYVLHSLAAWRRR